MTRDDLDRPYAGGFVGAEHRFALRVYFEDTDLTGVVYHANYLRYMERARSDMLRAAGIDQRAAHDDGTGAYAIADLAIRYLRPARLDDALQVVSRVVRSGAATCVIHQTVMHGDEVLATAEVTAAFLAPGGRPRRQPRAWTEIFERLTEDDQGA
ncbi:YbgC/FadM family acyl-CoA thioesterase [Sphingomonas prati]|uniref:Acyl-CoA thioester hydrolase n=1 Tax=Sphingomonas prati TaxID=1843237 RepID=A0A7W9BRT2_9SPHN|nr:YbgC/FadM family acyl-CoA thioesterase [Sphingomonas prati]MBB5728754.1 acyl-CoA thioester hydrolase [Sphingomonas prati]GGE87824.1 tol-pal system-associated acyl-CoA thioesterase [Sphingomonas prati]